MRTDLFDLTKNLPARAQIDREEKKPTTEGRGATVVPLVKKIFRRLFEYFR